ncbi:MAG: RAD55 family ATPase [archaeon]
MKELEMVEAGQQFMLNNGNEIKSLHELATALESIGDEVFSYHVNDRKNDFVPWIEHVIKDPVLKNQIEQVRDKDEFMKILGDRIFELSSRKVITNSSDELILNESATVQIESPPPEDLPIDLPPDTPDELQQDIPEPDTDIPEPDTDLPDAKLTDTSEERSNKILKPIVEPSTSEDNSESQEPENSGESFSSDEIEQRDATVSPEAEKSLDPASQKSEDTVEIREYETSDLGLKELDNIFKAGVPKISNTLFVGTISSGKTTTALRLLLARAKKGEKVMYISLQDREEKIINILKGHEPKILEYINAGNIVVKKLDTFQIAKECQMKRKKVEDTYDYSYADCTDTLKFVSDMQPKFIIVDSLSALELSFSEKMCYRHYVDTLFKYFEELGVLAVFVKELTDASQLNSEFFENILADAILLFETNRGKNKIKLIKDFPIKSNPKKKFFSIFGK